MENLTVDQLKTQLFNASRSGNLQELQALMQKGVNLESKDTYGGTPLHYAVLHEKKQLLSYY